MDKLHTQTMASIPADARAILDQIGVMVLGSVGARDIVSTGDGVIFRVSRGRRKLVIKLAPSDTYVVERVYTTRDRRFVSEEVALNVFAEDLPEVVRRLGDV